MIFDEKMIMNESTGTPEIYSFYVEVPNTGGKIFFKSHCLVNIKRHRSKRIFQIYKLTIVEKSTYKVFQFNGFFFTGAYFEEKILDPQKVHYPEKHDLCLGLKRK
jgi:hypothetical protein